jgi:hypothetical protein
MFKIILTAMMLLMAVLVFSSRAAQSHSLDLSEFQWKNRLLILFAPNRNHPLFDAFRKSLAANRSEAADRDLVIFEILESDVSSMNNEPINSDTPRLLRETFDAQPGAFTVILIGKDGGVKLKRRDHADLEEIFDLIDSMPMRREEMRRKTK